MRFICVYIPFQFITILGTNLIAITLQVIGNAIIVFLKLELAWNYGVDFVHFQTHGVQAFFLFESRSIKIKNLTLDQWFFNEILPKWKNKNRKEYFCHIIPHFPEKNHQILRKLFFEKFPLHLGCAFSLVTKFKLFKKIFRWVLKTYHHLLLNPFWNAN
jgi:hypothetical protein